MKQVNKNECYGCVGCDYITGVEKDRVIKCTFEGNKECYSGNFIYVDGERVPQPSEPPSEPVIE